MSPSLQMRRPKHWIKWLQVAKARGEPHLIACIHLSLDHSPEGLLVLREKSKTRQRRND